MLYAFVYIHVTINTRHFKVWDSTWNKTETSRKVFDVLFGEKTSSSFSHANIFEIRNKVGPYLEYLIKMEEKEENEAKNLKKESKEKVE